MKLLPSQAIFTSAEARVSPEGLAISVESTVEPTIVAIPTVEPVAKVEVV